MHTFGERGGLNWLGDIAVQKSDWRFVGFGSFPGSLFPAYPNERAEMRPVTKIKIFGFRMGVVVLAAYWTAIFIGTHLPAVLDVTPNVNDKVKHFSAFFLLGTLMCYVTNSQRWLGRFLAIGLAGMAYAAIDELTQHLVAGRYPDIFDFLADSAGLWSAIGIYVFARYRFKNLVDSFLVAKT